MNHSVSQTIPGQRHMVSAKLMGRHTHTTRCGVDVHIWHRESKFLARGSYNGERFGRTLGQTECEAEGCLRQLLTEIENGTFVRPSQAPKRIFGERTVPRLTLSQLADLFLAEKRKAKGLSTERAYTSRLRPVIDFNELPGNLKKWPLAQSMDREFVVELRAYLSKREVTRNGHAGGIPKLMSTTQIYNVLDCLRTMCNWAVRADNRKLPSGWAHPLTPDLVGKPAAKDPLRQDKLPIEDRIKLVEQMDRWQLLHLSLSLVLPLRPDEVTGILIGEVDFKKGWLSVGSRFGGDDTTKEGTCFCLPFPARFCPLVRELIGGRTEGPLLRNRRAYLNPLGRLISGPKELETLYHDQLRREGSEVQATGDRKRVFRRLMHQLGGASTDDLAREFKQLLRDAGLGEGRSLYTLRHSITEAMKNAGIHELDLLYLTSHSTGGILNTYSGLDPVGSMRKYFEAVTPLLVAIEKRACDLGLIAKQRHWSLRDLKVEVDPD